MDTAQDAGAPDIVTRALIFATRGHGSQQRKYTGEPYIVHPIEVMMLVRAHAGTPQMQAAALLHDVVEDTPVTLDEIEREFGGEIALLVAGMTEPAWEGNRSKRKALECARLAATAPEVQTIKYADIVSNSASILAHGRGFSKVYIGEMRALLEVMDKGDQALLERARASLDGS